MNESLFSSLRDAHTKLAAWRQDFNEVRPHSSLGLPDAWGYARGICGENATSPAPHGGSVRGLFPPINNLDQKRESRQALRTDFGCGPGAIKHAARLVNANERAVRNWFEAKNGPSAEHLVTLIRHSDAVLAAVLRLADRHLLMAARSVGSARDKLREAIALLDGSINR